MQQRSIKFRAWDHQSKEMYDVSDLLFSEAEIGVWEDDQKTIALPWDERIELLQFTGLHDKNGQEVYEGDCFNIVLGDIAYMLGYKGKSRETVGEVKMLYGCWVVEFDDNGLVNKPLHRFLENEKEIIGNIYENPELLQKEAA